MGDAPDPDPGYDTRLYRPGAKFVVAAAGVQFCFTRYRWSGDRRDTAVDRRELKKGARLEFAGCEELPPGRRQFWFHGPNYWGWVEPCTGPLCVPDPGTLEPAAGNRRVRRRYLSPDANAMLERVSVLSKLPDECAAVRAVLADKLEEDGRVADAVEQRAMAGQGLAHYWVFPAGDPGAAVGPFDSRQKMSVWLNSVTRHHPQNAVPASLFGRPDSDPPLPLSGLSVATCLMARTTTAVDPADEWWNRRVLCPYGAARLKLGPC